MSNLVPVPFHLPAIGFGAMTFGDRVDRNAARSMIDICLEAGPRVIALGRSAGVIVHLGRCVSLRSSWRLA